MSIAKLIDNEIELGLAEKYCAILGESPSKGARSPILWNSCFEKLKIPSFFHPFDVSPNKLEEVVLNLKQDSNFIGGAIAVPYKDAIIPYLDRLEEEAEKIGAVNLIYKKDNMLVGSNTDGLGFVGSIANLLNSDIEEFCLGNKAIIFGTGGAAKACAVYLSKSLGKDGKIFVTGRSQNKVDDLVEKCNNYTQASSLKLNDIVKVLPQVDILVNATSLGYENDYLELFTPLGPTPIMDLKKAKNIEKKEWLEKNQSILVENISSTIKNLNKLNKECLVVDVVYQPPQTMLLKLTDFYRIKTFTGEKMNLLQAAYGFIKAFNKYENKFEEIISIMNKC